MFDGGLHLVHLDDADLEVQLRNAIGSLWRQAPALREGLRRQAAEQITAGTDFYGRVLDLVEARLPA
jgi:hypothetical protein